MLKKKINVIELKRIQPNFVNFFLGFKRISQ